MKLDIYLNYRGNCEQAFRFYEQHLGGRTPFANRFAMLRDKFARLGCSSINLNPRNARRFGTV